MFFFQCSLKQFLDKLHQYVFLPFYRQFCYYLDIKLISYIENIKNKIIFQFKSNFSLKQKTD